MTTPASLTRPPPHRTADGWAYGFPELSEGHRAAIQASTRVANPGCHATGFIASVYPLVAHGVLSATDALTCFSLTGYSGGGKKMIASYEAEDKTPDLYAPRIYGLNLQHKHLPEMQKVCGLSVPPVFCPVVDDYYKGMATTVMLPGQNEHIVWQALSAHYAGQKLVKVAPLGEGTPMLSANTFSGRDSLTLYVHGHRSQTIVTALFDNTVERCVGCSRSKYESHARPGRDHRAYPVKEVPSMYEIISGGVTAAQGFSAGATAAASRLRPRRTTLRSSSPKSPAPPPLSIPKTASKLRPFRSLVTIWQIRSHRQSS